MVSLPGIRKQTKQIYETTAQIYRTTTSPMRIMPDFIIIGVARASTTSLYLHALLDRNFGW